jgi:hypothetical protein
MAAFAKSEAIADKISEFRIFRPTLDVMSDQSAASDMTVLTGKAIAAEHGSAPFLVFVSADTIPRLSISFVSRVIGPALKMRSGLP